jgi:hypothetical protein
VEAWKALQQSAMNVLVDGEEKSRKVCLFFSRGVRLLNEMALATACGLWVVHRARIRRIYNNTAVTVASLWAEWRALLREIVLAKRCTAFVRGTLIKFCA